MRIKKHTMTELVVALKGENTMSGGDNLADWGFDADNGEKHPHNLLGQRL